ncbi:RNA polymerase sigma factor [Brevibacillus massiliensis]|jgi:RNA polymerase sigma-70 factor (ECF subfamily)|uniref:RNA polymerase sigma factor n=1 Tax=Brevibacillus massiliensis TaxID=1118054 RepID=UPI0002D7B61B|nr:sigma-70 family RNA polymerase sigma factor [Brevibacillus massiliensis]
MEEQYHEEVYAINREALTHIRLFLQGDAQAFRSLMELFGQRVTRIVQKMVYSFHDAQDVNNEIWLKVAQNLHKYDPSLPFHSWLVRLASNTCIDYLRKRREIVLEDDLLHFELNKDPLLVDTPESLYLEKEFHSRVAGLIEHLDEVDRLILTLRFTEQLSYEEIGNIVGLTKNTVGTRLFRARKQLKHLYQQHVTERSVSDVSSR